MNVVYWAPNQAILLLKKITSLPLLLARHWQMLALPTSCGQINISHNHSTRPLLCSAYPIPIHAEPSRWAHACGLSSSTLCQRDTWLWDFASGKSRVAVVCLLWFWLGRLSSYETLLNWLSLHPWWLSYLLEDQKVVYHLRVLSRGWVSIHGSSY